MALWHVSGCVTGPTPLVFGEWERLSSGPVLTLVKTFQQGPSLSGQTCPARREKALGPTPLMFREPHPHPRAQEMLPRGPWPLC